jgi:hypothetical protein
VGSSLRHLQLLGDALTRHIVRPPRRRRKTSLQANWWIVNEGDMGQSVGVLDWQPTKGVPKVDERGPVKIGNLKEETRGTQFRQVWAARCAIPYVLYAA